MSSNSALTNSALTPLAAFKSFAASRTRYLLLALIILAIVSPTDAQSPNIRARAAHEPITPIPEVPIQDSRRVALGEQLFADRRLSRDNTRSCLSCHDIQT